MGIEDHLDDKPWEKCPNKVEPVHEPDAGAEEFIGPHVKLRKQYQFLLKENRRLKNELHKVSGLPPQYAKDGSSNPL